jgi:hypothetical protein
MWFFLIYYILFDFLYTKYVHMILTCIHLRRLNTMPATQPRVQVGAVVVAIAL